MPEPVDLQAARDALAAEAWDEYCRAREREQETLSLEDAKAAALAHRRFYDLFASTEQRDVMGRVRQVVRGRFGGGSAA